MDMYFSNRKQAKTDTFRLTDNWNAMYTMTTNNYLTPLGL